MIRTIDSVAVYRALTRAERLAAYLDEPVANAIPTVECGEGLVDLRAVDREGLLAFAPEITDTRLREGAAMRLLQAAQTLHLLGYRLLIVETIRTREAQQVQFNEIFQQIRREHPELDEAEHYRRATQFICDPSRSICPHLTGGALDLRLLQGQDLVDMGSEFNAVSERSYLLSEEIPPLAQAQRKILLLAMLVAGFAPMPTEWWHYSYGDCYWAAYADQPQAIYGMIA